MVALVVTIVVLLILAGITITYVLGDNSVFKQAQEAKLKSDIAKYQEMLETAKGPIIIQGLGKFDKDKYFQAIQTQGIIHNKEKDVVDNGDGTYDVTTKPGYVFLVELIPNKENPTDAKIEYLGQAGKLPPRIRKINVIGKTKTSIDIEVEISRLEDGKISYYYREATEDNSNEYIEVKKNVTELTAKIANLAEGKVYNIKVVVENKKGKHELVKNEAIQQLVEEISLNRTTAKMQKNETLQLTATVLPENAENKVLSWSSSDDSIAIVDSNGLVTGKKDGDAIITVKSTDGGNVESTCSISVVTLVTKITLDKTTATIKVGETVKFQETVQPDTATEKSVTWSSLDNGIAIVDQSGTVTGKKVGTTKIRAIAEDGSEVYGEAEINIYDSINNALTQGKYVYYTDKNGDKRSSIVLHDKTSGFGIQVCTTEPVDSYFKVNFKCDSDVFVSNWNTLFDILDNECKKYLNADFATNSRCFGTSPKGQKRTQYMYALPSRILPSNYDKRLAGNEQPFSEDCDAALQTGFFSRKTCLEDVWYGSRSLCSK